MELLNFRKKAPIHSVEVSQIVYDSFTRSPEVVDGKNIPEAGLYTTYMTDRGRTLGINTVPANPRHHFESDRFLDEDEAIEIIKGYVEALRQGRAYLNRLFVQD